MHLPMRTPDEMVMTTLSRCGVPAIYYKKAAIKNPDIIQGFSREPLKKCASLFP